MRKIDFAALGLVCLVATPGLAAGTAARTGSRASGAGGSVLRSVHPRHRVPGPEGIVKGLRYYAMIGNNLSQFGVDAGQLDNDLNTFSGALIWTPTTGEYGRANGVGHFEGHEKVATRLAVHFTRSDENRQGQPDTEAFENSQIRLSDGTSWCISEEGYPVPINELHVPNEA